MAVDEQLASFIGLADAPDLTRLDPQAMRKTDRKYNRLSGPPAATVRIDDFVVTGDGQQFVGKRFTPDHCNSQRALLFFHGGSFVVGLGGYHHLLSQLAEQASMAIIALDYPLAPEHPAPAAIDHSWAFCQHIETLLNEYYPQCQSLAVAGDSAGGNIAAYISQRQQQLPVRIDDCLLVYPYLDLTFSGDSHQAYGRGYGITLNSMALAKALYKDGSGLSDDDPRLSPLFGDITPFHPPTFIALAEYDPMRSDGERYHRALLMQGVEVSLQQFNGMIHSFWQMGLVLKQANELTAMLAQRLLR